ncbi:hypothetical protein E2P81_ATG08732 [Venturia nashicola]|nr:hypothetical protein E2P81_ATG08732 [Venturia nashicola]
MKASSLAPPKVAPTGSFFCQSMAILPPSFASAPKSLRPATMTFASTLKVSVGIDDDDDRDGCFFRRRKIRPVPIRMSRRSVPAPAPNPIFVARLGPLSVDFDDGDTGVAVGRLGDADRSAVENDAIVCGSVLAAASIVVEESGAEGIEVRIENGTMSAPIGFSRQMTLSFG